jgi:hypothetical protein
MINTSVPRMRRAAKLLNVLSKATQLQHSTRSRQVDRSLWTPRREI